MSLLIVGINHNSAPLAVRERVAFAPERVEEALADGRAAADLDGLVILSTCNRTELFAGAADPAVARQQILDWLSQYHRFEAAALDAHSYTYVERDALRHMMQVASGLDSLVLGEPQIFGQMKSAYAVATEAGSVGGELTRAFPQVFSTAKQVRTDTAIGENPVSVAYAAVHLTQHIFTSLAKTTALLVGAGETIELVARHLKERGVGHMIVANRTLERARDLAEQFQAEAVLLSDIPEQLARADIVISSTARQLPILGKGAVESALKQRKHKPMLMVDIAVPRDIEAEVADLNDVYLYTVDDLRDIVDENRRSREHEARKADEIIAGGVETYYQQLRALDAVDTVRALRQKVEELRDAELQRSQRALAAGEDPERVLQQFARNFANKLMHSPSAQLRRAGASGRNELIAWSQELFDLTADTSSGRRSDPPPDKDRSTR